MIPLSAQAAATMILPILLLMGAVLWVLSAQRKQSLAQGQFLKATTMADQLGVGEQFAKLRNSASAGRYLCAMRACTQCKNLETCQKFLDGTQKKEMAAARHICPNVDLFEELQSKAA